MSNSENDNERVWKLILGLRQLTKTGFSLHSQTGMGIDAQGKPLLLPPQDPAALLVLDADGGWRARADLSANAAQLFDLYLPLCLAQAITIGHLGQSLDGRIATASGSSWQVTGSENICHLHRLRALCDAVVVGAETVRQDNPRLTTRHVTGTHPVRVILDANRRLQGDLHVFHDDAAPTLVVCDRRLVGDGGEWLGQAAVIGVPMGGDRLALPAVLERLHERGLLAVFVEGGGLTVSGFLEAGLLDRLQIAIAPLIIGSGRPGITLPVIAELAQALRPRCRLFPMGEDILFDCVLR